METLIEEDFLAARSRSGRLSSACRCKTRSKGNKLDLRGTGTEPVHNVQLTHQWIRLSSCRGLHPASYVTFRSSSCLCTDVRIGTRHIGELDQEVAP